MVAKVIDVHAEDDRRIRSCRQRREGVHQRRLAVIAAIAGVGDVGRVVDLGGLNRAPLQSPFGGQRLAIGIFVFGERSRNGCNGVGMVRAEGVIGKPREQGRIGAAAEGDDDALELSQAGAQAVDHRRSVGMANNGSALLAIAGNRPPAVGMICSA